MVSGSLWLMARQGPLLSALILSVFKTACAGRGVGHLPFLIILRMLTARSALGVLFQEKQGDGGAETRSTAERESKPEREATG